MNLDNIKARCIEEGECWIWQGAVSPGDVPSMRLPGHVDPQRKLIGVRRWVAQQMGKRIGGLYCTTSCEEKRCVCPDHIVVMTRQRLQKRAGKSMTKNQNPGMRARRVQARIRAGSVVIGYENARAIRTGEKSAEEWAKELGCSRSAVFLAKRGATWKENSHPFSGLLA